jgi:hypothetical protein
MIKLSTEAKVGLFVFIGILILAYMSLRLGGPICRSGSAAFNSEGKRAIP